MAAREQLDSDLGVARWGTITVAPAAADIEPDAPAWWQGDEEASQSFLRAMGVRL